MAKNCLMPAAFIAYDQETGKLVVHGMYISFKPIPYWGHMAPLI